MTILTSTSAHHALSAVCGLLVVASSVAVTAQPPEAERVLAALNEDYLRFVQHGDVVGFKRLLADDFLCSNPDGTLIDRAAFLAQTARPVTITRLRAHDVAIRVMGDVALVHARTTFTNADGSEGHGRYTDVYARRGGRWLAVSAHVTRVSGTTR